MLFYLMDPDTRSFWFLMLAKICLRFGSHGFLDLDNEQLTFMYIECLAVFCCFVDKFAMSELIEYHLFPCFDNLPSLMAISYCKKCVELNKTTKFLQDIEDKLHLKLGELFIKSGQFKEAYECLDYTLSKAKESGNKLIECQVYVYFGNMYSENSQWNEAKKYYQKYLDMDIAAFGKLKMQVFCGLGKIAECAFGNSKEAIKYHEMCLELAKDVEDNNAIAASYGNLGECYSKIENLDKAKDCFQMELKIAIETNNKQRQCTAYGSIGTICFDHQYDKAIEWTEKGIAIAKELGWEKEVALGYSSLGDSFYSIFENLKAMKYYQKALEIYEVIGDKGGKDEAYLGLGKVNIQMGKYSEGLKNIQWALDIAVEIGDKPVECRALYWLGNIHLMLGKSHEANEYYQKSVELALRMDNYRLLNFIVGDQGRAYHSIGSIQKAEECYEYVLTFSLKTGFLQGEGEAYNSLAKILILKGKHEEAIENLQKSLDIATRIDNKHLEAQNYLQLGRCFFKLKSYSNCISCYEKALLAAECIKHTESEAEVYSDFGILYHMLGVVNNDHKYYQKSEVCLREALKRHDFVLFHLRNRDGFKISSFKGFVRDYNCLTEVLMQTHQEKEALLISERGRGRSLNDLLISKYFIFHQDVESPVSPILTYDDVQEFLGRSKLCILFYSIVYKCIIWVLVQKQPILHYIAENQDVYANGKELSKTELYIEMLVGEAYEKMKVRGLKIKKSLELESNSGHKGEVEVLRADSKEDSACATQSNQAEHPANDTPKKESKETDKPQDNRHPLVKLFDILVAPVQSSFTEEEIVIVPQGPLYLVPFAALKNSKDNCFLIDTKRIRLAPSITALKTWQECPADYHSGEGALVIGNPTVGKVILDGKEETFHPLLAAEKEAEFIAKRLEVIALTGCQATKEEVKKRLAKSVAVIHIAAHGDSKRGEIALAPSQSAIQNGIPEEEDYMLTMREVHEIGIRAKLVVLSCCHSGRGDIEPEGLVGMSRAFLASGARAVIASLWPVDDNATFHFMSRFYIYLRKGNSASESLQKTMKYLRNEGYKHPKYWAPFYLIGDDVKI